MLNYLGNDYLPKVYSAYCRTGNWLFQERVNSREQ